MTLISCRGLIGDAQWAQIRALFFVLFCQATVARLCRCSRWSVQQAIKNDTPPTLRQHKTLTNTANKKRIRARRQLVRSLVNKKVTVVGEKVLLKRGRPRMDGRARETYTVTKKVDKLLFPSPQAIARVLGARGILCSRWTVANDLKELGMKCYVRSKACALTPSDEKSRLSFADVWKGVDPRVLAVIVFTDEKWFDSNDQGVMFQYCDVGQQATQLLPRERQQYPAKVMVWGAIGVGFRFITVVEWDTDEQKGMRTKEYIEQCLRPVSRKRGFRDRLLMQDGATLHWTAAVRAELVKMKVEVIDPWPPHSPDMNPIENMWAIVAKKVSERGPFGVDQLRKYVVEEFYKVPDSVVDALVLSFHRRLERVVERQGKWL